MAGVVSGGAVNFLNIAYLIEIAVVLNLTYRELKFPQLYDDLKEKAEAIYSKCKVNQLTSEEDGLYTETMLIKRLLLYNVKNIKKIDKDPWESRLFQKYFFKLFIKNRCSLRFVNINIVICICILVFSTYYSHTPFEPHIVSLLEGAEAIEINKIAEKCWFAIFYVSIYLCILPLVFIRLGSLCETYFYGKNGKSGIIKEIEDAMLERKRMAEKNSLKDNELANKFTVKNDQST